jgi:hypothetical protein
MISISDNLLTMRPLLGLEELAGSQGGKMTLIEARVELDKMRLQDRY